MSKITVLAGDFIKGSASIMFGSLTLRAPSEDRPYRYETISLKELEEVEIATQESVRRVWRGIVTGVAGAALLGPVGMLAGLLAVGKKTEITFAARFKDGRKLLGTTDAATFKKLQAAVF